MKKGNFSTTHQMSFKYSVYIKGINHNINTYTYVYADVYMMWYKYTCIFFYI